MLYDRNGKGLKMSYDANGLKYFTQWKMLGEYDYAMGLEPGNCTPDGRDVMREKGALAFLHPLKSWYTQYLLLSVKWC